MVVGDGLIANAFKKYKDSNSVIIFASGVSNSRETRQSEFEREKNKLKSFLNKGRLVYFSTCSISDPTLKNSPYVLHKIDIENYIINNFEDSIIFRLPIIVGESKNPNTIFNYFKNRISNKLDLIVDKLATRYLIDVDDLYNMLSYLIDNGPSSEIINIALDNKILISDMVKVMEDFFGNEVNKEYVENGSSYDIDNKFFLDYLRTSNVLIKFISPSQYNYDLIKKYT